MPTDRPPFRSGPRRTPATPVKIPTGPPIRKYAPYIMAAAVIAVLVFLVRMPRYATVGAFGIALVIMAALGYVCLSYRASLPPGDQARALVPIVTVVSLLAAAIPLTYTTFPPPPRAEVDLAAPGDARSVAVTGSSAGLWLTVTGRFVPTATGHADYFLTVSKASGPTERVFGRLDPHPGRPASDQRVLAQRAPGRFTVRLDQLSSAVAPPLHVAVHTKPVSTLTLALLYTVLALLVAAVDAMLWRRNIEPSFAAALLLPLVAAVYFQHAPPGDAVPADLLRAGVVGALGGGLGGELLARIARLVIPEPE
jgi:hypothetical protein